VLRDKEKILVVEIKYAKENDIKKKLEEGMKQIKEKSTMRSMEGKM
jgi:hypothetical protein